MSLERLVSQTRRKTLRLPAVMAVLGTEESAHLVRPRERTKPTRKRSSLMKQYVKTYFCTAFFKK